MLYAQKTNAFAWRAYSRGADTRSSLHAKTKSDGPCSVTVVFAKAGKIVNVLWSNNEGVWWLMEDCRHETSSRLPISYLLKKETTVRRVMGHGPANLLDSILMPYRMELL